MWKFGLASNHQKISKFSLYSSRLKEEVLISSLQLGILSAIVLSGLKLLMDRTKALEHFLSEKLSNLTDSFPYPLSLRSEDQGRNRVRVKRPLEELLALALSLKEKSCSCSLLLVHLDYLARFRPKP